MKLPSVTDYQGSGFHYLSFITRYLWGRGMLRHMQPICLTDPMAALVPVCVIRWERELMVQRESELCREIVAMICCIIVYFTALWVCWLDSIEAFLKGTRLKMQWNLNVSFPSSRPKMTRWTLIIDIYVKGFLEKELYVVFHLPKMTEKYQ